MLKGNKETPQDSKNKVLSLPFNRCVRPSKPFYGRSSRKVLLLLQQVHTTDDSIRDRCTPKTTDLYTDQPVSLN